MDKITLSVLRSSFCNYPVGNDSSQSEPQLIASITTFCALLANGRVPRIVLFFYLLLTLFVIAQSLLFCCLPFSKANFFLFICASPFPYTSPFRLFLRATTCVSCCSLFMLFQKKRFTIILLPFLIRYILRTILKCVCVHQDAICLPLL